jgi:hypothetical protein
MPLVFVCDYETGTKYSFNVDGNTTIKQLKQMFASKKEGVNVEGLCAWVGTPLNNDNKTLDEYDIAYNGIIVFMATEWTEYMKVLIQIMKKN